MEWIEHIKEVWGLIALLGGGFVTAVGTLIKWRMDRNKSTEMLYASYDKLKQKLIDQTVSQVDAAFEISKKNQILNELKLICPECYQSVMQKLEDGEDN